MAALRSSLEVVAVARIAAIGMLVGACGRLGYDEHPRDEPVGAGVGGFGVGGADVVGTAGPGGSGGSLLIDASTQDGGRGGGDVLLADAPSDTTSIVTGQRLAIPSYFATAALWSQLGQAAPGVGIAIVNPSSGPGNRRDAAVASMVSAAQAAGVAVIGFVETSVAGRSLPSVEVDVDSYFQWYAVNGIVFSNAGQSCADEPYYATLFQYVKATDSTARVVLNPGTAVPECYMAAADILLTYNDTFAKYGAYRLLGWESAYPSQRFWHLVYATPALTDMQAVVDLAKQRGAGWIYVTPDTLPNPWDSLPSDPYWSAELAAAAR